MEHNALPRVGVIGLTGQTAFFRVRALPRSGETVRSHELTFEPGGKGHNQAIACVRAGIPAVFVAAVGEDVHAQACREHLDQARVDALLFSRRAPTAFAAVSTQDDGENFVQVFSGAAQMLAPEDILSAECACRMRGCQFLLVQNELPRACLEASLRLAAQVGTRVIFNPAPAQEFPEALLRACFLVTPNADEARCMAGFAPGDEVSDDELWRELSRAGARRAAVTLGGEGVLLADERGCRRIPAFRAGPVVDTTGAGDVFNGALAAGLALGEDLDRAALYAVAAASISVTRFGTADSCPARSEVLERAAPLFI